MDERDLMSVHFKLEKEDWGNKESSAGDVPVESMVFSRSQVELGLDSKA